MARYTISTSDKSEALQAMKATNYLLALWDVDQWLRGQVKYAYDIPEDDGSIPKGTGGVARYSCQPQYKLRRIGVIDGIRFKHEATATVDSTACGDYRNRCGDYSGCDG